MTTKVSTSEPEVTVVIRSVDERTEAACQQLLAEQVNERQVHLIHQSPFSAALKKSYEIGLAEGRQWTLVIDADVLIRPNIVSDLVARAERAPRSVFAVQSEMLDKFFGGVRVGGLKLYRTHDLTKAIKLVPAVHNRPETFVIKHMHTKGYHVDISDLVCGLHDFEQYYVDIFRKGFAHGIKHAALTDLILPYWRRAAKTDQDFVVLLAGYELGKQHTNELQLAKDEVAAEFKDFMRQQKLTEKPPLKTSYSSTQVEKLMQSFKPPAEYAAVDQAIIKMGRPTIPKNIFATWFKRRLS